MLAASWAAPAARAASAAETSRAYLSVPSGVSAEAWASTLARRSRRPRSPARSATRSSRSATAGVGPEGRLGGVPGLELRPCPGPTAAAASAAWTRRRSLPGAAPYTAERTSGCRKRDGDGELDEAGRLGRRPPRRGGQPQRGPGGLDQVDVPGGVRRRHQQPPLLGLGQQPHPAQVVAPRGGGRPGSVRRPGPASREALHAELAGEVDQRQRVAAGRDGDLRRGRRVDGLRQRGEQQRRSPRRGARPATCSRGTPAIWARRARPRGWRAPGPPTRRRAAGRRARGRRATRSRGGGRRRPRRPPGVSSPAAASSPSTPRPTRNRSGGGPAATPAATLSACWCRSGSAGR